MIYKRSDEAYLNLNGFKLIHLSSQFKWDVMVDIGVEKEYFLEAFLDRADAQEFMDEIILKIESLDDEVVVVTYDQIMKLIEYRRSHAKTSSHF